MLGGSVIKVVSCCKINYFGQFSTIIEDFDWTKTVGEVKGSFFSWSFPPWWPKSTKSHDLVFENSITGATGARNFFVHVNLPKPISFRRNRISFKEWSLFLTMPPPKKYFWALRRAVLARSQSHLGEDRRYLVFGTITIKRVLIEKIFKPVKPAQNLNIRPRHCLLFTPHLVR